MAEWIEGIGRGQRGSARGPSGRIGEETCDAVKGTTDWEGKEPLENISIHKVLARGGSRCSSIAASQMPRWQRSRLWPSICNIHRHHYRCGPPAVAVSGLKHIFPLFAQLSIFGFHFLPAVHGQYLAHLNNGSMTSRTTSVTLGCLVLFIRIIFVTPPVAVINISTSGWSRISRFVKGVYSFTDHHRDH
jgi:hypothetical protein